MSWGDTVGPVIISSITMDHIIHLFLILQQEAYFMIAIFLIHITAGRQKELPLPKVAVMVVLLCLPLRTS